MCGGRHHELKKMRRYDFRLNEMELAKFKAHGLVVSERLAVNSFAEAYYRTYTDDLPVLISADSILHAWHMSFSKLLQGVEKYCLYPTFLSMFTEMHTYLLSLVKEEQQPPSPTEDLAQELDYYLSVFLSILNGSLFCASICGRSRVQKTLQDIEALKTSTVVMFGERRDIDFSQFMPRGHYASDEVLSKYFRAIMWLNKVDFRLCKGTESSRKQLKLCLLLLHVLKASGQQGAFEKSNQIIEKLMGVSDSLDVASLQILVSPQLDLVSTEEEALSHLESLLLNQSIGKEMIQSHVSLEGSRTPRSFCFFGQKFTLDAFVFTNVTFDRVFWKGEKIQRRRPSGIDIAFSVLGNNIAVKEISRRIKAKDSKENYWRDGKPYAHHLSSLRRTIDQLPHTFWGESIYTMWLHALRALSHVPAPEDQSLRATCSTLSSEAWKIRCMNTQLGSWTELKHDTVLYTKQAYAHQTRCEYPEGLVEPVPEFFLRMSNMVQSMKNLLDNTDIYGQQPTNHPMWMTRSPTEQHAQFLEQFDQIMMKLHDICCLQANKKTLSMDQTNFLKSVMEERFGSGASRYLGWYPKLFFGGRKTSGEFQPRVTDVFTAPNDPVTGDTGGILHMGVGKIHQMMIAVNGIAYVGPVFSLYEFETPVDKRLTDEEWKTMIQQGKQTDMPPLQDWAKESFLAVLDS